MQLLWFPIGWHKYLQILAGRICKNKKSGFLEGLTARFLTEILKQDLGKHKGYICLFIKYGLYLLFSFCVATACFQSVSCIFINDEVKTRTIFALEVSPLIYSYDFRNLTHLDFKSCFCTSLECSNHVCMTCLCLGVWNLRCFPAGPCLISLCLLQICSLLVRIITPLWRPKSSYIFSFQRLEQWKRFSNL